MTTPTASSLSRRYTTIEVLRRRGAGEILRAFDNELGRPVAITRFFPVADRARERDRARRLVDAARAAAGLRHANVVAIYDLGVVDGVVSVVTELAAGGSLFDRMPDQGRRLRSR